MVQSIDTKVLIVGAGFCGRAVAVNLNPADYIIIDCGEPISYETILNSKQSDKTIPPVVGKIPSFNMGYMDANWQSYLLGGNSNWWGGWTSRISDNILSEWIDLDTINSFYAKAEKLLNSHGDTESNPNLVGEIPGAKFWKEWGTRYFNKCQITSETKNFSSDTKGMCLGRGTCRACPENAKTIPSDIKVENLGVSTKLIDILISDGKAYAAIVEDVDGKYQINFEKIVIAAGGFENVAIAKKINPDAGKFFQDHTSAEILVKFDKSVPYRKIGAESHLEIDDFKIEYEGIEIKTILLTAEPSIKLLNKSSEDPTIDRNHFGQLWLQIEIPSEWNLELKHKDGQFYVDYTPYFENLHLIDYAIEELENKIKQKSILVCAKDLGYRRHFGGYHLSGTTMIGKIVDDNCKMIGVDGIYFAGASVVPRAGGSGPSLTAVALSLRLGEYLKI
jgi:choline dehydrogenase-like flavoprotein